MRLRYRIESRGWFIPQFQKNSKWYDFTVRHLGEKTSHLYEIAVALGEYDGWRGEKTFHFIPNPGQKVEDMALIFKNELKVCAFLGAAKVNFSIRTREFDFQLDKDTDEKI